MISYREVHTFTILSLLPLQQKSTAKLSAEEVFLLLRKCAYIASIVEVLQAIQEKKYMKSLSSIDLFVWNSILTLKLFFDVTLLVNSCNFFSAWYLFLMSQVCHKLLGQTLEDGSQKEFRLPQNTKIKKMFGFCKKNGLWSIENW